MYSFPQTFGQLESSPQCIYRRQSGRWPETQFQDLPKRIRIAQSLIALEQVDPFGSDVHQNGSTLTKTATG